jgi:hypothetical protein
MWTPCLEPKRYEYLMPSHQTKQDQKNARARALTKQVLLIFHHHAPFPRMQIGQRQSQRYIYRLQDSPASYVSFIRSNLALGFFLYL